MPTFIVLMKFTEQGIRGVKESPARYEAFKAAAGGAEVGVKDIYWTVGHYDIVLTVEGSDEQVTAALLRLGAQGNVRTETLRAFAIDEMKQLVAGMA